MCTASTSNSNNVKLPQFEIKVFSGKEPTEWSSFYESFLEAMDKNQSFADIEKMNYLAKSLSHEALTTVKGLKLSNYHVALDLLTERFGDPQLLISAHIGNMLNLPNFCSINDLQELRFLYDHVETEVRSLDCLGLPTTNYGPTLVPVLMEKSSSKLKLRFQENVVVRNFGTLKIS